MVTCARSQGMRTSGLAAGLGSRHDFEEVSARRATGFIASEKQKRDGKYMFIQVTYI
jgi:hypothetical protein